MAPKGNLVMLPKYVPPIFVVENANANMSGALDLGSCVVQSLLYMSLYCGLTIGLVNMIECSFHYLVALVKCLFFDIHKTDKFLWQNIFCKRKGAPIVCSVSFSDMLQLVTLCHVKNLTHA